MFIPNYAHCTIYATNLIRLGISNQVNNWQVDIDCENQRRRCAIKLESYIHSFHPFIYRPCQNMEIKLRWIKTRYKNENEL